MLSKVLMSLALSLIMLPGVASADDFHFPSEKIMAKDIPKEPRKFDGMFDEKRYGDWFLKPVYMGYRKITSPNFIPTDMRFQIVTPDILGNGHILGLSCFGYVAADEGQDYHSITFLSGSIASNGNIRDYSKYSFIFDDSEIAEEPTAKFGDNVIPIALKSDRMSFFLKNFQNKSKFKGVLSWSDGGGGIVFEFSLSGFSSAYRELNRRCRDSTYITYNGVVREK